MITTTNRNRNRIGAAVFALLIAAPIAGSLVQASPAAAQHTLLHKAGRHHRAVGAATGIGAYAALHHSASRKRAMGRRPNFAERHPILSGAVAGIATNHMLKKHYQKTHRNR